jgi:DNA-binding response OmpR family regulator
MAFDDYLIKPVSGAELLETVEQLLYFDRYEDLLAEYHALTRKYATLQGAVDDDSEVLMTLERRREAVCDELEVTVASFSDEEVRRILERAHGNLP